MRESLIHQLSRLGVEHHAYYRLNSIRAGGELRTGLGSTQFEHY
jgi:hypothetical protein